MVMRTVATSLKDFYGNEVGPAGGNALKRNRGRTGPRQTGRHVYVTPERTLIKVGLDHTLKVQTFDN